MGGAPAKLIWISETALRSMYKRAAAHSSRASGVAFVQSTDARGGEDASRGCTQPSPMTINRPLQQATRDQDIVTERLWATRDIVQNDCDSSDHSVTVQTL